MSWSRSIGTAFIVAGTAIGGGMLALPIVSAKLGFLPVLMLMLVTWLVMCWSSLLTLEINLLISPGCSFLRMTSTCLGAAGRLLSTLSFLFLFYALLAAYISGASSFLKGYLDHYPLFNSSIEWYNIAIAMAVSLILVVGISTIDRVNRFLFIAMIACFIMVIGFLLIPAKMSSLLVEKHCSPSLLVSILPVIYTAFGYHGCITPLIGYIGKRPLALRWIFIAGSLLPLLAYILWLVVSLGVLTPQQKEMLISTESVTYLISMLNQQSGSSSWFLPILNMFSGFAILTSFLGVALGLFDYIYSLIGKNGHLYNRVIAGFLTLFPPLLFAIFYPNAFVAALGYAAIPLAFIATVLPVAMMWALRRKGHVFSKVSFSIVAIIFAALVILAQLGIAWGLLPSIGSH